MCVCVCVCVRAPRARACVCVSLSFSLSLSGRDLCVAVTKSSLSLHSSVVLRVNVRAREQLDGLKRRMQCRKTLIKTQNENAPGCVVVANIVPGLRAPMSPLST